MTLEGALSFGKQALEEAGIVESALDAWYLLEYVGKFDRNYYYLHYQEELEEEMLKEYEMLVKKRAERIPLQYITGTQEFMGLEFKVNPNVLIPRQDTEILVETALGVIQPEMRVLDMCTGSGCIIISLMHFAKDIIGVGSDISKQALLTAKENAKVNEVEVEWIRSDLFQNITGTYDIIVSNPPYIPTGVIETLMPEVRDFEPITALDGQEDGLYFYEKIVKESYDFLNTGGYLIFEIGHDQGEAVSAMMKQTGYEQVRVIRDLSGLNRVVCGRKE